MYVNYLPDNLDSNDIYSRTHSHMLVAVLSMVPSGGDSGRRMRVLITKVHLIDCVCAFSLSTTTTTRKMGERESDLWHTESEIERCENKKEEEKDWRAGGRTKTNIYILIIQNRFGEKNHRSNNPKSFLMSSWNCGTRKIE